MSQRVKNELKVIGHVRPKLNVTGHFVRRPWKRYFKACSPSSTLSFQYFSSTWSTLYSMVIFENEVLFCKTDLVICHLKS
jgi:hypothetical protein